MNRKLLIFHPTIAPYRIDFFNDLHKAFETRVCLRYRNLRSQKFDYDKIAAQFEFEPIYQDSDIKGHSRKFYWKNLDEFKPDIVIVEEFSIGAVYVLMHRFLKQKKYKVISICDDSYNMVAENNDFSKAHRAARRVIVPRLDGMILVEPMVAQWYSEHYGKGTFFPIIKPDEKARNEYKRILPQSLNTAKEHCLFGKRVFLFVGRLVNIKNIDSAIRAFAKLDQNENVLVIVGDGPEKDNLIALSKEIGTNTIFTGRLEGDTLYAWYNIAQVFILPSLQEPFGAVTNEALLAGCKGLISEKAGSKCLIENGVNGYTISPNDINEITEKMLLISKEIEPLKEVVLKKNEMIHRYDELIDKTIEYINSI